MTLNTAYCRHLRLAGQHHPRRSQWQVFRLDREARASGAAIGPIVETILPRKPPEGPPEDHSLKRAMLTRVLSAPKA